MRKIVVCDGKYTLCLPDKPSETLHCLRHGEPWRNLIGDGMVLALGHAIEERDEQITALRQALGITEPALTRLIARTENPPNEALDALRAIRNVMPHLRGNLPQALAATEPEAEEAECWEGCEDPQCPYTHPQHQRESR